MSHRFLRGLWAGAMLLIQFEAGQNRRIDKAAIRPVYFRVPLHPMVQVSLRLHPECGKPGDA
jgi:hypothetical protein